MAKILRKCSENDETQVPKFTFLTCEKSILAHSLQAPLQRSKLSLIILVNKDQTFYNNNGNLF